MATRAAQAVRNLHAQRSAAVAAVNASLPTITMTGPVPLDSTDRDAVNAFWRGTRELAQCAVHGTWAPRLPDTAQYGPDLCFLCCQQAARGLAGRLADAIDRHSATLADAARRADEAACRGAYQGSGVPCAAIGATTDHDTAIERAQALLDDARGDRDAHAGACHEDEGCQDCLDADILVADAEARMSLAMDAQRDADAEPDYAYATDQDGEPGW